MADRFYQGLVGSDMSNKVTESAASVPAAPFEFRMTYDATGVNKLQALKALDAMRDYITQDTFPPV